MSFKTCCSLRVSDQNLEIHVRNTGEDPVVVPSLFDLVGEGQIKRIETLMPHGRHRIDPGKTMAFYCSMDEQLWQRASALIFYDDDGKRYVVPISKEKC